MKSTEVSFIFTNLLFRGTWVPPYSSGTHEFTLLFRGPRVHPNSSGIPGFTLTLPGLLGSPLLCRDSWVHPTLPGHLSSLSVYSEFCCSTFTSLCSIVRSLFFLFFSFTYVLHCLVTALISSNLIVLLFVMLSIYYT